ncbi:MAG: MFS transporter [Parasphingorhabdus sp.]
MKANSPTYSLLVLAAVFGIAHLDRNIFAMTLNAVGAEFVLSNTQLGMLSGLVFAVIFVITGIPVARLAAYGNRRNIVSVSTLILSLLTMLTGAAQNFWHLLMLRLGVGGSEAGIVAPSHAMISDLYPQRRVTSALAAFSAGANVGVLLAFLIGGVAGQAFGWRAAFIIAAVPGFILALLLRFTVPEPDRDVSANPAPERQALFRETLKTIWNDKGLRQALYAVSLVGIVTFGALAWNPTFIIRGHQLSAAQTGIYLAVTVGVIGGLVTWQSGRLADRLGDKNPRWRFGLVIVAILVAKPFVFGFLWLENTSAALLCFVFSASTASVFWGPTFSFLHSRVRPEMRAMATAIFLFAFNLIGLGIGPTLVGFASDTIFFAAGDKALSWSLLSIQMIGFWAAWHYWMAMRQIPLEN